MRRPSSFPCARSRAAGAEAANGTRVTAVPLLCADFPALRRTFAERDAVLLGAALEPRLHAALADAARRTLDRAGVRRDLAIASTGGTRRRYRIASRDALALHGPGIAAAYRSSELLALVSEIAGEPVVPVPYEPEEFIATRLERPGDEHGWHWDDYAYALVFVLRAAPERDGGSVEFVRRVAWDKRRPRVAEHVRRGPVERFHPAAGSAYLLRAATALHRVTPLAGAGPREMLCFSYTGANDARRAPAHETLDAILRGS